MSTPSPTIRISSGQGGRLHGIDSLRAAAAVLVVALHAAHAYIPNQMPGLIWPVHDQNPSALVDGLFWAIESFIMPLFLWMSGYFAFGLLERNGPAGFVRHRVKRILYPLVLGCLVILPLDLYSWAFGLAVDGQIPLKKLRSLKFPPEIANEIWGLSHLWFLQYVFLYSLIAVAAHRWASKVRPVRIRMFRDFGPMVSILAIGITMLFFVPEIVIGFQHSWFPVPPKTVYSATFFFGGWWMATRPASLRRLASVAPLLTLCAFTLLPFNVRLTHAWFSEGFETVSAIKYAVITVGLSWCFVAGLIGFAARATRAPSSPVRYVAEASFWIYLLHHPVVGFVHTVLNSTSWPTVAKFVASLVITLSLCLLTYSAFVRRTWMGELLNGPRQGHRPTSPALVGEKSAAESRRAA